MASTTRTAMIAPAIAPALLLLPPDVLELVSLPEVVSEIPEAEVEEAEEVVERPALVVVGEEVVLAGARRVVEEEEEVEVEEVERVEEEESVEEVSSSSSSVEVVDARAVVRRVVLVRSAEDEVAVLTAEPRP